MKQKNLCHTIEVNISTDQLLQHIEGYLHHLGVIHSNEDAIQLNMPWTGETIPITLVVKKHQEVEVTIKDAKTQL